jgi:hypothetical protein
MTDSSRRPLARLSVEKLEDRLVLDATSFVTGLYQNLLNRSPDAGGLAGWVAAINNGMSNQAVATAIWQSQEHRTDEVTSYYQTFLGRSPDSAGLAAWVNLMMTGQLNEQGVEIAFLTSGEYLNNHPTADSYITGLYLNLLNRSPQIFELAIWEPILSQNGTTFVSAAIVTSTEKYIDVITSYYQTYLNRAPDSNGLQAWLNNLVSGPGTVESVAEAILGSAEYAQIH